MIHLQFRFFVTLSVRLQRFIINITGPLCSHHSGENIITKIQHRSYRPEIIIQQDILPSRFLDFVPDSCKNAYICPAETVNGLLWITYYEESFILKHISVPAAEQINQLSLPLVGILEFIYHNEFEPAPAACQHFRMIIQQIQSHCFQIVEPQPSKFSLLFIQICLNGKKVFFP